MSNILTMTSLIKKKIPGVSSIDSGKVAQVPGILRMTTLPPRGRSKPAKRSVKKEPVKILTLADLPKRAAVAKTMAAQAKSIGYGLDRLPVSRPKVFSDFVQNNMWKGRRCFIVGGGPSLKDVDVSLLHNELTIGINRAYELFDPSILFGVDGQMWGWVEQGKYGEESKRKFNAYKGYKVWMALHEVFPPDFYLIDVDDSGSYKIGSTNRLAFKNNSGYGAINLAAALGANPIYLLGFDMQGTKQGKQQWWHDGHPVDYGEGVYDGYIREISRLAPVLKDAGVKVVNLNPKSKLKCFTFGDYSRIIDSKPKIQSGVIQVMERPNLITAITPTGDRKLPFALCKHWMEMQTVRPDQWIVVDDGKVPMKPPVGVTYIRREPCATDPPHTLNINLKTAIPYIKGSKILIIEDDEYYAPQYVGRMAQALDKGEVAGIAMSKYYHLPTNGWARHANTIHASLAQTGFRSSFIPTLSNLVSQQLLHYLDICLWKIAMGNGVGYLFKDDPLSLYAGIKGLPGRLGIGIGHQAEMYSKRIDTQHKILREWTNESYKVYADIKNGVLTEDNCDSYFPQITGITVCQNTKDFIERAYNSIRSFHPDMPIIIVDGSDVDDPCASYVHSLRSHLTKVIQPGYNIGHGKGMCVGIDHATTPCALIFDSDIEMLKSPVDAMMGMMEPDTFGVGYTELTALDGFEYKATPDASKQTHTTGPMKMLHPYFHLINIANYRKYHPYVHHGAPCYLTARDIYNQGLSDKVIKEFPGLGHSSGKGHVWEGEEREYIRHDPAGTRNVRKLSGKGEIEGGWVRE